MFQRLTDAAEVWAHKRAFAAVRAANPAFRARISLARTLRHDLGKLVLIVLIGDRLATRVHRAVAGHHNFRTEADLWEAACDWECARVTKPAKPLTGPQTWAKYYAHLPMAHIWAATGL